MPLAKCGGCGRFIASTDGVKCGNCSSQYHRACVGLPVKGNISPNWRCPECNKKTPRDNKAETPVRATNYQGGTSKDVETPGSDNSASGDDSREVLHSISPVEDVARREDMQCLTVPVVKIDDTRQPTQQRAGSDLQLVLEELKAVRAEIQAFRLQMRSELSELKGAMVNCNTRLDSLETRVEVLEQRACSSSADSPSVGDIVEELRRELNDRDQDLLANDIEITNVPESNAENPVHILMNIGSKLGVTVEERDIVSAERVGGRHISASSPAGAVEQRPRAIVVRLARRDLRDQLLSSARVRRGATTADLGMPGPSKKFFLNERLTKTNRQLFRRTRDAASLHGWRYAWTKRGRILVRSKPGDPTCRIRSESDICAIIGRSIVDPLSFPKHRTAAFRGSFKYAATHCWNDLPPPIRNLVCMAGRVWVEVTTVWAAYMIDSIDACHRVCL